MDGEDLEDGEVVLVRHLHLHIHLDLLHLGQEQVKAPNVVIPLVVQNRATDLYQRQKMAPNIKGSKNAHPIVVPIIFPDTIIPVNIMVVIFLVDIFPEVLK